MRPLSETCADMPLAELMARWPGTIPVFLRHRMICVGCHVTAFHTVSNACAEYDLDEEAFWAELDLAVRSPSARTAGPDDGDRAPGRACGGIPRFPPSPRR